MNQLNKEQKVFCKFCKHLVEWKDDDGYPVVKRCGNKKILEQGYDTPYERQYYYETSIEKLNINNDCKFYEYRKYKGIKI